MAKYEKKMMQFEAFQYDGDLIGSNGKYYAPEWAQEAYKKEILFYRGFPKDGEPPCELYIRHPDGEEVHVPVGYYIIRWSDTELYPCEPSLFEASYTPALCEAKAKCLEIANEYGYDPQSRQIIEEMAELIVAINKYWRIEKRFLEVEPGGTDKDMQRAVYEAAVTEARYHIVKELADVQIMIWQMSFLLGLDDGELKTIIDDRISRQLERIEKQHEESGGDAK